MSEWHSGTSLPTTLPLPLRQYNPRRIRCRVIHTLRRFLKVVGIAPLIVRHKLLRVARDQRKPCALNLHHDAVALLERVDNTGHHVREFRWHVGPQRLGLFKAVTETRGEGLASEQHLITTGFEDTTG